MTRSWNRGDSRGSRDLVSNDFSLRVLYNNFMKHAKDQTTTRRRRIHLHFEYFTAGSILSVTQWSQSDYENSTIAWKFLSWILNHHINRHTWWELRQEYLQVHYELVFKLDEFLLNVVNYITGYWVLRRELSKLHHELSQPHHLYDTMTLKNQTFPHHFKQESSPLW